MSLTMRTPKHTTARPMSTFYHPFASICRLIRKITPIRFRIWTLQCEKHVRYLYIGSNPNIPVLIKCSNIINLIKIEKIQINFTSDSVGGSPPASSSNTLWSGFSVRRPATTEPAEPAPTTMKSKSGIPKNRKRFK